MSIELAISILFMSTSCQFVSAAMEKNSIRGRHLILAAKEGAFFKSNDNSAAEPYRGPIWMILKYLQEGLNFTFELNGPLDGTVGYIYDNGSWSGLIGMINRSEVDFGIGPFHVNTRRAHVVDFSYPIHIDKLQFIIGLKTETDPLAVLSPFGWRVWIGVVLAPPLYWLTMGMADVAFHGTARWSTLAGFIYRSIVKEVGEYNTGTRYYNKIFIVVWIWSFSVLIYGYEGTLTAQIIKPSLPPMIEGLEDLVNQDEIKWGLQRGTSDEMLGYGDPPWSNLKRFNVGAERIDGGCGANVGKINEGKFACLAEGVVTKIIISRGLSMTGTCNYYVTADNPIYSTMYAMAFQKNVKFKEEVNVYLRRQVEAGLIHWWIGESLSNAAKCDTTSKIIESHKREIVSLRLNETGTFFLILATGHILATIAFLAELLSKKGWVNSREIYMGHAL